MTGPGSSSNSAAMLECKGELLDYLTSNTISNLDMVLDVTINKENLNNAWSYNNNNKRVEIILILGP